MLMKIYTLLTACLCLCAMDAQSQTVRLTPRPQHATLGKMVSVQRAAVAAKAASDYTWSTTILQDTPEGELKEGLSRSMSYFTFDGYSVNYASSNCSVGAMVKGTDGAYYLSEPISQLYSPAWLRLQVMSGDTLVAHFPQPVYSETGDDGQETFFYAFPMKKYLIDDGWGGTSPFLKLDTLADGTSVMDSIRFVLRNDSLIQIDDNYMGLVTNQLEWAGYGDGEVTLNMVKAPRYVPTADELALADDYLMRTGDADSAYDWQVVKAIVATENVYVRNPYNNKDGQWIKGTIQGDKVHFDGNQYFGIDSTYYVHLYAMTSNYTLHEEADPTYGTNTSYYSFAFNDGFDMNYDAASKSFGVGSEAGDTLAWLINAGNTVPYFTASYIRPYFSPYTEVAATPADPEFQANQCVAYTADNGYGYITFHYSKFDENKHFMNADKYFYRVYMKASKDAEAELFTFTPDQYASLSTDMTEIPVKYADRNDFFTVNGSKDGEPTKAWASFNTYTDDFYAIGVQLVYKGAGEEHASQIKWWSFKDTGVNNVETGLNAVSSAYYGLDGSRVVRPQSGVYMKVTRYQDGSRKVEKVIGKR